MELKWQCYGFNWESLGKCSGTRAIQKMDMYFSGEQGRLLADCPCPKCGGYLAISHAEGKEYDKQNSAV